MNHPSRALDNVLAEFGKPILSLSKKPSNFNKKYLKDFANQF
jgi:hypothetical protein